MKLMPNKRIVRIPTKNLVPGSRIPIAYLLDYIKAELSVKEFIASYPWVKKSDVDKALDEIKKREFTSQNVF